MFLNDYSSFRGLFINFFTRVFVVEENLLKLRAFWRAFLDLASNNAILLSTFTAQRVTIFSFLL